MGKSDGSEIQIREFLYLDVERVKSALAQMNEGLVENEVVSDGSSKSGEIGGKASVLGFASAEVTGGYLKTNSKMESTVRHDFAFNLLESQLIETERLRVWDGVTEDALEPSDYVLVEGSVSFDDFGYLAEILERHQELMVQILKVSAIDRWNTADSRNRNSILHLAEKEGKEQSLPKWFSNDLVAVLRTMFGDALFVRSRHRVGMSNARVAGPLSIEWLRDSVEHLRYKYGLRPEGKWRVFGQVTTMPTKIVNSGRAPSLGGLALTDALDVAFSSLSQITSSFDYPNEVKISPIAIYRERSSSRKNT